MSDAFSEAAQEFDAGFNPFINREDETVAADVEHVMTIVDKDMRDALRQAAELTCFLVAMKEDEDDEHVMSFIHDALRACYNDGRVNSGKENDDFIDLMDDVDALMYNSIMTGGPVSAMHSALMSVYVRGYDSQ